MPIASFVVPDADLHPETDNAVTALRLADFIRANLEPILAAWDEFARSLLSARGLDLTGARDHAEGMLLAIADDLDRAPTPLDAAEISKDCAPREAVETQADLHGAERQSSGYSLADEVAEFRALRASVLRLWRQARPSLDPEAALLDLVRFNEAVDQALAESIARYSADQEQQSRLFGTLLSSSPDLNFIFGLDGRFLYASDAIGRLYGIPQGAVVGKTLFDLGASAAEEFHRHLDDIIRTQQPYRGDMPCHVADTRIYEFIMAPVLNAEGAVEAVAGTARDMTERRRLESDLLREKAISDTIIESAPGAFFMIDDDLRLSRWNKALGKETGLADEQIHGSSIVSTIYQPDQAVATAKFLAAFATGQSHMEVRVLTPDRGLRTFLKSARRFVVDEVPYLAGFCLDVTDRKQTEDTLTREKAFSDALIESIPGAFFVLDTEGNYFRWNSYLKRLTGLSDNELLGRAALLSIHEGDLRLAAGVIKEAFDNGYAQAELRIPTQDRGLRLYFTTLRRFQAGAANYLVCVGMDTTEWLARMKELEHEAWTDPLTQVPNRSHFLALAKSEFARCRRYGHPLSLWMLDIDHFKTVNDTYGHQAGDVALQAVATTSREALRDWDILGRMGGEEFAVLLPETESAQSQAVAERLRQIVSTAPVPIEPGETTRLTVSIGIATAGGEDNDLEALLGRADRALYEAKRTGRDKVCRAENLEAA
jgi:diguanylate cyclase (GGDEF)-like protein/PAS domain S-box-containing protein